MRFPFALRRRAAPARAAADRVVPARNVVATVHGSRTVLLDVRKGRYWGLDEVGSRAWALAQEGHTVAEIVRIMSEAYDAAPGTIEHDVRAFFERLRMQQLIEVV